MAMEEWVFIRSCCPIFCFMEYKFHLDRSVHYNKHYSDYKTPICNSSIYTENKKMSVSVSFFFLQQHCHSFSELHNKFLDLNSNFTVTSGM